MSAIAVKTSATGTATVEIAAPITNMHLTYDLPKHGGKVSIFGVPAAVSATGTSVDFINGTGDVAIPDDARRITVMLSGISTNGTGDLTLRIGDSGGIETTNYLGGAAVFLASSNTSAAISTGFLIDSSSASNIIHGVFTLVKVDGNTWACHGASSNSNSGVVRLVVGTKTLSGTLDRVRLATANGTDTFDAGTVAILVE